MRLLMSGLAAAAIAAAATPALAREAPRLAPAPLTDLPAGAGSAKATLSGGCFWGVQGVFEHVKGVTRAVSGYAGGMALTADYETVSTGMTNHAETVQITYDPAQVSYGTILRIFFSVALDPTQVGGQYPDRGSQYRSEIWTASEDEARVARAYIAQLDAAHVFGAPIATRVDTLPHFYAAETYHQDYLTLHPTQSYIAMMDMPKVQALRDLFPAAWRDAPVTVNPLPPAS